MIRLICPIIICSHVLLSHSHHLTPFNSFMILLALNRMYLGLKIIFISFKLLLVIFKISSLHPSKFPLIVYPIIRDFSELCFITSFESYRRHLFRLMIFSILFKIGCHLFRPLRICDYGVFGFCYATFSYQLF